MDLVIAADSACIRGGLFEKEELKDTFYLPPASFNPKSLQRSTYERALVAAEDTSFLGDLKFHALKKEDIKIAGKEKLSLEQLVNAYGALSHFPKNDCLIIDLGEKLRCDLFGKEGSYLGGAVFNLPVSSDRPSVAIGTTEQEELASGNYFGMLGAIERIVFEMKTASHSPGSVQIIATGAATRDASKTDFLEDLVELTDLISPHLTLLGLHQLLKETIISK